MNSDRKDLLIPSMHHYVFAHNALRGACMSNPMKFIDVMASPQKQELLQELWDQVCSRCSFCEAPSFSVDDVTVTDCTVGGQPACIITMPPPQSIGEAYFIGIVPTPDCQEIDYYLTLEKAAEGGTVLCRWTTDGCHINYGHGPRAVVGEFIMAMEDIIRKM